MRIEKDKKRVAIICEDGSVVKGFVHINPGTRLSDFIASSDKSFMIVTDAELFGKEGATGESAKKRTIFLNKSFIKLVEEI